MELDFRHADDTAHLNMAPSPTNSIITNFILQETTMCPYKTEAPLDDDDEGGEERNTCSISHTYIIIHAQRFGFIKILVVSLLLLSRH
jgi:hypothetical protein